jgi:hypothetical protein
MGSDTQQRMNDRTAAGRELAFASLDRRRSGACARPQWTVASCGGSAVVAYLVSATPPVRASEGIAAVESGKKALLVYSVV